MSEGEEFLFEPGNIPIVPPEFSEYWKKLSGKTKTLSVLLFFPTMMFATLMIIQSCVKSMRGDYQ